MRMRDLQGAQLQLSQVLAHGGGNGFSVVGSGGQDLVEEPTVARALP